MAEGDVVELCKIAQRGVNSRGDECDDGAINTLCFNKREKVFFVRREHRAGYSASTLKLGTRDANKPGIWHASPRDAFRLLQKSKKKDLNRLLDAVAGARSPPGVSR